MKNEISDTAPSAPYSPSLEIVTPLSTRMLFWRARYLKNSSFLPHLPFMFWLIELCRPKSYVALGVGEGVSYFAACQALDKLETDSHCHGIDTWPEAESGRIPEALRNFNSEHYADFSRLMQADPREAVRRFPDGSIDLLHVDMDLDQSLLDSLVHDWTRKLSRRAVVLLHGLHSRFSDGPAQTFLERITNTYPTATLEEGDGLVMVLYGPDREDRLAKLTDLRLGMPGYTDVHRVFARLGATHRFEWASRNEAGKAAAARKKQDAAEQALKDSEKRRAALEEKLAARDAAYDRRSEKIAELQAKLFDLQQAHDARGAELDGLRADIEQKRHDHDATRAKLEECRTALSERDAKLTETRKELEKKSAALTAETERLETRDKSLAEEVSRRAELEARITELTQARDHARAELETLHAQHVEALARRDAALAEARKELEKKSAALTAETERLETRFQEIATLTEKLEKMSVTLEETRSHRDALLDSTSWKLTSPMRKTINKVRALRS